MKRQSLTAFQAEEQRAEIDLGYQYLLMARACFKNSPKTLARMQSVISSARGAKRAADYRAAHTAEDANVCAVDSLGEAHFG